MSQPDHQLLESFQALRGGKLSRREFMTRAVALGVGTPMALMLVNSIGMDSVAAQDQLSARPDTGMEPLTRGAGGELRVRLWYTPNNVFTHLNKDSELLQGNPPRRCRR